MSNLGEHGTGDLYNQVFAAYKSQVQNSTYTAPLGTQTAKDDGAAATAKDPNSVFVNVFKSPMQGLPIFCHSACRYRGRLFQPSEPAYQDANNW